MSGPCKRLSADCEVAREAIARRLAALPGLDKVGVEKMRTEVNSIVRTIALDYWEAREGFDKEARAYIEQGRRKIPATLKDLVEVGWRVLRLLTGEVQLPKDKATQGSLFGGAMDEQKRPPRAERFANLHSIDAVAHFLANAKL